MAPGHLFDQFSRRHLGGSSGRHDGSIPQYGHAVCNIEHVVEPVAHVNDCDTVACKLADERMQGISLLRCQRRGGLVQHEQLTVAGDCARDFDELTSAKTQLTRW